MSFVKHSAIYTLEAAPLNWWTGQPPGSWKAGTDVASMTIDNGSKMFNKVFNKIYTLHEWKSSAVQSKNNPINFIILTISNSVHTV